MLDPRKLQENILKLGAQDLDRFKKFDCTVADGSIVLTLREPRLREFIAFLKMNNEGIDPMISYLVVVEDLTANFHDNGEDTPKPNMYQLAYLHPEIMGEAIKMINRFFLTLAKSAGIRLDVSLLEPDGGADGSDQEVEATATRDQARQGSAIFIDPTQRMGSRTDGGNAVDRTVNSEINLPNERQELPGTRQLRRSTAK